MEEELKNVIGETFDFEDFLNFTVLKARASELESLIILSGALSKMERFGGTSVLTKYIAPLIVGLIGIGIALFILKSLGILPI